ncbi:MAG: hypothetical protein M3347_10915 [Armatimonadota bacterium]|nr:hypothetical protein [Armatimonadota bacterium]
MILYIETNFIIGRTRGQDAKADEILKISRKKLNIALPDICIMEAWSAFENMQGRRRQLADELSRQAHELKRDLISPYSKLQVVSLEQASLDIANGLNDSELHFRDTLAKVAYRAELITLTPAALKQSLAVQTMSLPRDNLVLTTIINHARKHRGEEHILLTGDREFEMPARNAGMKYFARTEAFLGWFKSKR